MITRLGALIAAVLVSVVSVVSVVGVVGVADAQTYPPGHRVIVIVEGDLVPGGSIIIEAETFQGNGSVSITINGTTTTIPLGSAVALPGGLARLAAVIPLSTEPGTYTLTATGLAPNGQPLTISTPIRIVAVSTGQPSVAGISVERPAGTNAAGASLARTGAARTLPMTQLAVGVIVAGGLLVLAAERRRSLRAGWAAEGTSSGERS